MDVRLTEMTIETLVAAHLPLLLLSLSDCPDRAADDSGLESCREIARKYLAWQSIVKDEALSEGLTRAQYEDASSRIRQAAEGLAQRARSTLCLSQSNPHILVMQSTQDLRRAKMGP
jgi:hypothetical protein